MDSFTEYEVRMTKCETRMAFDYELSTVHCEIHCGLICPAVQRRRLVQVRWKTGRLCGKRRDRPQVGEERNTQSDSSHTCHRHAGVGHCTSIDGENAGPALHSE